MVKTAIFLVLVLLGVDAAAQHVREANIRQPALSDTAKVTNRLEELFECARTANYEKAAHYLVYRGKDSTRAWQDHLNYADPTERKEVEKICHWFTLFLKKGNYQYQRFQIDPEPGVTWYAWNVTYDENGNHPSVAFAFKKIKGEFCLADIDEF